MKNEAIILKGTIIKGLGEGAYFMSMPHYKKEIKKKLGFDAYPGTLNIKIKKIHNNVIKKIKDINGAIIIPDINKHKSDIVEFIAPIHIKSKFKIRNGCKIKIELL